MKQYILNIVLLTAMLPVTAKAESYTCIATQIAGFVYNAKDKSWQSASSANESVYILRQPTESDVKQIGPSWFVNEPGKTHGMACKQGFNSEGYIECSGLGGRFIMNKQSLRFEYIYDQGYVEHRYSTVSPEGKQAPHMKIGTCSVD